MMHTISTIWYVADKYDASSLIVGRHLKLGAGDVCSVCATCGEGGLGLREFGVSLKLRSRLENDITGARTVLVALSPSCFAKS